MDRSNGRLTRRLVIAGLACGGLALPRRGLGQWPSSSKDPRAPVDRVVTGGCNWDSEAASRWLQKVQFEDLISAEGRLNRELDEISLRTRTYFDIDVDVAVYDDFDGPNARATPLPVLGSYGDLEGSVLIGRRLVASARELMSGGWRSAVAMVFAHEYAHILQYRGGGFGAVLSDELHADYLAGWTLGKLSVRGHKDISDRESGLKFLRNSGSRDFSDPTFHGTAGQRREMFASGYARGRSTASRTPPFSEGMNVVAAALRRS